LEAIEKGIKSQLDDLKVLRMHMENALAFEPADNAMVA
jgi:hypothetical protein